MIPDHDCVPGLERPVTVREYARLEGLSEAQVLTLIQQLKLRKAAYFRGQWFIEAPPNCEARLAQLRGKQPTPRNDKANVPRKGKGNIPALEDEEFWGPIEREAADAEQNVMLKATEHLHGPRPQPTRESAPEPKSAPAQPRTVGERPQPIVPDHVPGLERPVTLGEYAKLQGLREEDMLAVIGQLKIPSAYFQGQWYVEAPLNCEARLAQLRGEQQDGANKATEIRENISQQPAREPRQTNKIPSIDALRISIGRKMWGYDDLSDAEKKALLNMTRRVMQSATRCTAATHMMR
jgi:hypothetical protein